MGVFSSVGRGIVGAAASFRRVCEFTGEAVVALVVVLLCPWRLRFGDFALAFQRAAFSAIPVATGIGLLLGLILAFESAAALRMFAAEVYVSDLLAIGIFRELGPLVTAIVLAGRSGSAFAAEIGTMKVDEELDALTTMGLSPVRFLVPPRVLAAVVAMPVLTILAELAAVFGGAAVLKAMGIPTAVFWEHVRNVTSASMLVFGLVKSCLFGLLVGLVGCGAGMNARTGADGVGVATTSAVVGGMVAIAVADGLAAVVAFAWGI